jgi:hypothetical protein
MKRFYAIAVAALAVAGAALLPTGAWASAPPVCQGVPSGYHVVVGDVIAASGRVVTQLHQYATALLFSEVLAVSAVHRRRPSTGGPQIAYPVTDQFAIVPFSSSTPCARRRAPPARPRR